MTRRGRGVLGFGGVGVVASVLRARGALGAFVTALVTGAAVLGSVALSAGPAAATATATGAPAAPPFDLAVGASASVGFQPTWAHPHGQATDDGYADVLATREASRWPGLTLVRIGCPGITTQTMIGGGGHCTYQAGSQLQTALTFLRAHPTTVLVTIDLGFNDLLPCLRHMVVDATCVDSALATVRSQLPQILTALRQAAPAGAHLVGVGHYDPFLGDALRGPDGHAFALATLGVITRLNEVLRTAYDQAGLPMADVGAAFAIDNTRADTVAGLGTVPTDVARACSLTWMCSGAPLGPNFHPNDAGYRVVAEAIASALRS